MAEVKSSLGYTAISPTSSYRLDRRTQRLMHPTHVGQGSECWYTFSALVSAATPQDDELEIFGPYEAAGISSDI